MSEIRAVVFDAYGTLFDAAAACRRHAARLGEAWEAFSALWRAKQLEYTWTRSLSGASQHRSFARVVDDSLAYAAAVHRVNDTALVAELRDAFDRLEAFADARPSLSAVRARGIGCSILSNGTPSMLGHLVRGAGLETLLDHVLSVEAVGTFKPDPRVYHLAVDRLGISAEHIAFVSSNAWDVFGAHAFGMRAVWVNRRAQPDEYGLRGQVPELGDLSGLPAQLD